MKTIASRFAATAVAATAILVLAAGCARHRSHDMASDPEGARAEMVEHLNDALDRLDATKLQRERILEAATPIIDDIIVEAQRHRSLRGTLSEAWMSESIDVNALQTRVDTKAQELTALSHRAVRAAAAVRAILTPAQRAEVAEHMGGRRHRSHGWFR